MSMSIAHEAHLKRIQVDTEVALESKYRKGQAEHGGQLWNKPRMLDEAKAEAIDLVTYLHVAAEQKAETERLLSAGIVNRDWSLIEEAYMVATSGNADGETV